MAAAPRGVEESPDSTGQGCWREPGRGDLPVQGNREQTADGGAPGDRRPAQARVKRCGKSAPASGATPAAGNPHPEQGQAWDGRPGRCPQVGRTDGWPPGRRPQGHRLTESGLSAGSPSPPQVIESTSTLTSENARHATVSFRTLLTSKRATSRPTAPRTRPGGTRSPPSTKCPPRRGCGRGADRDPEEVPMVTQPNVVHHVATLAQLVAHSLHDVWPQVEHNETLRNELLEVAAVIRYLVAGDPPRAAEHLGHVDDLLRHHAERRPRMTRSRPPRHGRTVREHVIPLAGEHIILGLNENSHGAGCPAWRPEGDQHRRQPDVVVPVVQHLGARAGVGCNRPRRPAAMTPRLSKGCNDTGCSSHREKWRYSPRGAQKPPLDSGSETGAPSGGFLRDGGGEG